MVHVAASSLSSNTLKPPRTNKTSVLRVHAGKSTQLDHSSLDRLTDQKHISPPLGRRDATCALSVSDRSNVHESISNHSVPITTFIQHNAF